LAALVTFGVGAGFGLFSSSAASQANTFHSATVTLSESAVQTCTIGPMAAGESSTGWSPAGSDAECSFTVTYNGSVPVYLGLDVSIASTHAGSDPNGVLTGATGLYDSTVTGLQVKIADSNGVVYMSGTTLGGSPTSAASPSASNLLESVTPATNGTQVTYKLDYQLPSSTTNAYMHAASSITLVAHAVQAANNGSTTGCTAGQVCGGIHGWS
jgi:hypothetical protein